MPRFFARYQDFEAALPLPFRDAMTRLNLVPVPDGAHIDLMWGFSKVAEIDWHELGTFGAAEEETLQRAISLHRGTPPSGFEGQSHGG